MPCPILLSWTGNVHHLEGSRLSDTRLSDSRFSGFRLSDSRFDSRFSGSRFSDFRLSDSRLSGPLLAIVRCSRIQTQALAPSTSCSQIWMPALISHTHADAQLRRHSALQRCPAPSSPGSSRKLGCNARQRMADSYTLFTEAEKEQLERWTREGKSPGDIAALLGRDVSASVSACKTASLHCIILNLHVVVVEVAAFFHCVRFLKTCRCN